MPNPPSTFFPKLREERQKKEQGIDFPRAYRALIKGFVRAKTARRLKDTEQERDEQ